MNRWLLSGLMLCLLKTLTEMPVINALLKTINLNRMNNFFRFYMFGVLSIMPQITTAQVLTPEQILCLLKDHNPTLARADERQASLQTAKAHPNPEREIDGGSSTGIGQGTLNGGNQLLFLSQPLELPFVRELENAYNRYLIHDRQVKTFAAGLPYTTKKALQVAGAAYRLGGHGFLDYLYAQCTYRSDHNDYL
jgi:hypothetical protein